MLAPRDAALRQEQDFATAALRQRRPRAKHGISFKEAVTACDDSFALVAVDTRRSTPSEERTWLISAADVAARIACDEPTAKAAVCGRSLPAPDRSRRLTPPGCDAHCPDAEGDEDGGKDGQSARGAGRRRRRSWADSRAAAPRLTDAARGRAHQRLGLWAVEAAGLGVATRAITRFAEAGGRTETLDRAVGRREAKGAARPVDVELLAVSRRTESARRGLRVGRKSEHQHKNGRDYDLQPKPPPQRGLYPRQPAAVNLTPILPWAGASLAPALTSRAWNRAPSLAKLRRMPASIAANASCRSLRSPEATATRGTQSTAPEHGPSLLEEGQHTLELICRRAAPPNRLAFDAQRVLERQVLGTDNRPQHASHGERRLRRQFFGELEGSVLEIADRVDLVDEAHRQRRGPVDLLRGARSCPGRGRARPCASGVQCHPRPGRCRGRARAGRSAPRRWPRAGSGTRVAARVRRPGNSRTAWRSPACRGSRSSTAPAAAGRAPPRSRRAPALPETSCLRSIPTLKCSSPAAVMHHGPHAAIVADARRSACSSASMYSKVIRFRGGS